MTDDSRQKLSRFPFVLAGMSFIPLVGLPLGFVTLLWGLFTKRDGGKKLALLGGGGIAWTMLLYGGLFYFGFFHHGGIFDELRQRQSVTMLTQLVQAVEFYKTEHGAYPQSLEELEASLPKESFITTYDPTDMGFGREPKHYYYELIDSTHYYLLGVGADGQPLTDDDILPDIEIGPRSRVGLVLRQER